MALRTLSPPTQYVTHTSPMPLSREYASAANPAPGSWVIVIDLIFDFSSHAKVGRAKSPGTPKLCRTPRRCRYSNKNAPIGIRAGTASACPLDDGLCRRLLVMGDVLRIIY